MTHTRQIVPGTVALSGAGWTAVLSGNQLRADTVDDDAPPSSGQGGTRLRCKNRPFRDRY